MGIDCRYCHTSVENSQLTRGSATKTCMNCHSQIWINSPTLEPVRESYRTNNPSSGPRSTIFPITFISTTVFT